MRALGFGGKTSTGEDELSVERREHKQRLPVNGAITRSTVRDASHNERGAR